MSNKKLNRGVWHPREYPSDAELKQRAEAELNTTQKAKKLLT